MKAVWIMSLLMCLPFLMKSQQDVKFHSEVSVDTVLQGKHFEIRFLLEGAEIQKFQSPDLSEFQIASGPNQSTQVQYMNGKMKLKSSYSFILIPETSGLFIIEPAAIKTQNGEMKSEPIKIVVLPNPNGFQPMDQIPKSKKSTKQKGKVYTM